MRAFIALALSPLALERAAQLQLELKRAGWGGRLMRPAGMHLTLHFLGELPATEVGVVSDILAEAGAAGTAFRMELAGVGAFPGPARPRTVWMGVLPSPELDQLQADMGRGLRAAGLSVEDRPFRPHVTLARDRRARRDVFEPFSRRLRKEPACGVDVREVHLYESRLGPGGASYTVVATSRLKGESGR